MNTDVEDYNLILNMNCSPITFVTVSNRFVLSRLVGIDLLRST